MTQLLTTHQAAERLNISVDSIRRAIRRDELPTIRIGRSIRIDPHDIDRFTQTRKQGGSAMMPPLIDVFAPNPNYRPPAA